MPSTVSPRVAAALGVQAVLIAGLLTVALDQYAHRRVEQLGGVNARGYRGSVLHARQPGEIRLLYAGGSQAFGWGVAVSETTAAYLRHLIENTLRGRHRDEPVTMANVATLGLDAAGYAARVNQYQHLRADLVCLHFDLGPGEGAAMPPRSAIATLTGYTPMLPIVLQEKAWFGVDRIGMMLRRADARLDEVITGQPPVESAAAVTAALDAALQAAGRVIVILPAPLSASQVAAHVRLQAMLRPRVEADGRLRLVDLAAQPALSWPALRIDGANLGAGGHSLEAEAILPAALDLLQLTDGPATR